MAWALAASSILLTTDQLPSCQLGLVCKEQQDQVTDIGQIIITGEPSSARRVAIIQGDSYHRQGGLTLYHMFGPSPKMAWSSI